MDQTTNFGMSNFQCANNNMNQINNFNGFNNPMLNQYNEINPMLNQMDSYYINNPMLNQMNNYYQNNLMLNQMMAQMMMMNQMMEENNKINQEKIKLKEIIQNINLNNLNINQMELLINSIIKFYKENGNEYMNFDNPNQIKNMICFLSLNYQLDKSDNIEDPLYYIKEPKKMIKFINSNYKEYKVKIPLSITKYDLYSIAQKYKCFHNNIKHVYGDHSNILLINNNLILNRDETSIECINNNDIIIIIEPRNFPDDSYYKSLLERTKNKENITFEFSSGKVINRIFLDDIKIYEIYKSLNLEFGLDIFTYKLLFSGLTLKINDQNNGSNLFRRKIIINESESDIIDFIKFGKFVIATIKYNIKNGSSTTYIYIGILNSVKNLIEVFQYKNLPKKLKKFTIGNKAIEKNDTMSLFSLGIKNNFTCFAEFED